MTNHSKFEIREVKVEAENMNISFATMGSDGQLCVVVCGRGSCRYPNADSDTLCGWPR